MEKNIKTKTSRLPYEEFIGKYSLQKTLRNELRPTPNTQKHIEEYGLITEDELRAEKRKELKDIMDDYYRDYINEKLLSAGKIEWQSLFDSMEETYRKNTTENKKKLEDIQKCKRKELNQCLCGQENYKFLFSAKLITELLPEYIKSNLSYSETEKNEKIEIVKLFSKFGTTFGDYFLNRKNVFSGDDISTSVCHRIVNVNAGIFFHNMHSYKKILQSAEKEIDIIEIENADILQEWKLAHIFTEDFFGMLMTQKGIDFYNEVCGKVNLHMNLYCQQTKENKNLYRMKKLQKQILSITMSTFEIPSKFANDKDVYDTINKFIYNLNAKNIFGRLSRIGRELEGYDLSRIYITQKSYEDVSQYVYGNWNVIDSCIAKYYEEHITGNAKSKEAKIKTAIKNDKFKSINDINTLIVKYNNKDNNKDVKEYIEQINNIVITDELQNLEYNPEISLIESEDSATQIKEKLDIVMNIVHWIKAFKVDDTVDKDLNFYTELDEIYDEIESVVTLYNKARNYITQKPFSQEKIKLNFSSPTLAKGWSKSKEYDNNAIIMLRDEKIYLGIFNAHNKPDKQTIQGHEACSSDTDYKKMVYYLLPGANKMLPKVFISSETGRRTFNPSEYILSGYKDGKHIKSNDNFDIKYCHDLIDYFKDCINIHPEWKKYNFNFSDTASYNDISEFYKEIESQGYKIDWAYISEEDINRLDEEGKIYLFQIYNKDFSDKSNGTANLHTMYLKNLFSEENLKNIVLKLNGEAELFFRKSSIKNPVIHKKYSVLVNKSYIEVVDGNEVKMPIPDEEYMCICNYLNKGGELTPSARKYYEKSKYFEASKDIVKDYRYSIDKYFIHLPITINFKNKSNNNINDLVLKYIADNNDIHIIGIDRGERNLIYVSLIDLKGNIIEQKSFNIVNKFDYKKKLKEKEHSRNDARKNWKEIGRIKELKEGYLSLVVHEITEMMMKYNAIIAMEDLNYGFKRGRFKVERQVYQKFETMLISKLAYLTAKSKKVDENGGILRGYQLTYIPERMTDVGRQCGVIFYVPAAYTSKIDPSTGFVNVFKQQDSKNGKDFLMKFDSIQYDKDKDMFRFSFDYNNFVIHNTTIAKTKWNVYTNDTRIRRTYVDGKWGDKSEIINLTSTMKDILKKASIKYEDGHDIKQDIETLDEITSSNTLSELTALFKYVVQMRNSKSESEDENYDRLISPVINEDGTFFDSLTYENDNKATMPKDADANGAYCIALKGLYEVIQIKNNWVDGEKFPRDILKISNYDWFDFIQNKRYL